MFGTSSGVTLESGMYPCGQTNPKRLGGEAEQVPVTVEGEAPGWSNLAKPGFVVAEENPIPESIGSSPGHLHDNGAVGASGEDFHCAVTDDAGETATGNDSFELYH